MDKVLDPNGGDNSEDINSGAESDDFDDNSPDNDENGMGDIDSQMNSNSKKEYKEFALKMMNSAWINQSYSLKPMFVSKIENAYQAEVTPVSFQKPATAVSRINSWVSKATEGKVNELVSRGDVHANTA